MTIEDLAEIMQRTMASKEDLRQFVTKDDITQLHTDIQELRTELHTEMQDGFRGVNRRIDLLREDISDLPDIREELKDHDERLVRVERKVGSTK